MGFDLLKEDFCNRDFCSDTLRSLPLTVREEALGEGGIPSSRNVIELRPTQQIALNKWSRFMTSATLLCDGCNHQTELDCVFICYLHFFVVDK